MAGDGEWVSEEVDKYVIGISCKIMVNARVFMMDLWGLLQL